jgi:purine-binding chemotaxis protein CheW
MTDSRALQPAPMSGAVAEVPSRPVCTFRLGEGLYGFDVPLVQSVNVPPPLTPVPHAPPPVRGCVNLRGQIHLVLDLKRLLRMEGTAVGPDTRLVVFKPALGDPFGVLVDRVGDIVRLRPDEVETRRPAEVPKGVEVCPLDGDDLVLGVGKPSGELLTLLDARKLLQNVARLIAR